MDAEARFKETFDDCMQAANDPEHHVLVAHMWENGLGLNMGETSRKECFKEVDTIFGVMGKNPDVCYDDTNYFQLNDDFPNRVQRGGEAGLVGIATCPLINAPLSVYPYGGNTGIIMKEPTPVFVSYNDAWSLYYEKESDIPPQKAWDAKCRQTGVYSSGRIRRSRDNTAAHSLLRDDPEARKELAGKLAIFRTSIRHRDSRKYPREIRKVLDMQIPEGMRRMPSYLLLDPHSPQVHSKAKAAYSQLVGVLKANPKAIHDAYAEVDVNATLENAAGILAFNHGTEITAPKEGKDPNWSVELKEREKLARALYQACVEHEQLSIALREHGINYTPTIIIHQPQCKDTPLVHFPPTQRNKQLVEGVMKHFGYATPPIDKAAREFKSINSAPAR